MTLIQAIALFFLIVALIFTAVCVIAIYVIARWWIAHVTRDDIDITAPQVRTRIRQSPLESHFVPRCGRPLAASEQPAPAIRPTMTPGAGSSIEASIADALAVSFPNRKRAESA